MVCRCAQRDFAYFAASIKQSLPSCGRLSRGLGPLAADQSTGPISCRSCPFGFKSLIILRIKNGTSFLKCHFLWCAQRDFAYFAASIKQSLPSCGRLSRGLGPLAADQSTGPISCRSCPFGFKSLIIFRIKKWHFISEMPFSLVRVEGLRILCSIHQAKPAVLRPPFPRPWTTRG